MREECLILGGLVPDVYYRVDRWPQRGQDGFLSDETVMAGGCAVNMAVTAENLGVRAHVVSSVGSDSTAEMLAEYLKEHGLSERFVVRAAGPSGKCFVFVESDGERTFLTQKGAEGIFSEALAEKILSEDFSAAGITGYYLLNEDAERVVEVAETLRGRGTKILFDPSPLVDSIRPDLLKRILDVSDVLTPNVTELAVLEEAEGGSLTAPLPCGGEDSTGNDGSNGNGGLQERAVGRHGVRDDGARHSGVRNNSAQDGSAGCGGLQESAIGDAGRILIVKDGSAGGTVYLPGGSFRYEAKRCQAVDTTGAGDSFSGALLYAMTKGMNVGDAVRLAAKCAAKTVTIQGPHGFWRLEE